MDFSPGLFVFLMLNNCELTHEKEDTASPINYCPLLSGRCQTDCNAQTEQRLGEYSVCGGKLRCCVKSKARLGGSLEKTSSLRQTIPLLSNNFSMSSLTLQAKLAQRLRSSLLGQSLMRSKKPPTRAITSLQTSSLLLSSLSSSLDDRHAELKFPFSTYDSSHQSLLSECGIQAHSRARRIVGGVASKWHEFPWIVYISRDPAKDDLCGASLISHRHVLTAAHCFNKLGGNWPTLTVGMQNVNDSDPAFPRFRTSNYQVAVHPKYNPVTFSFDIAVLTLSVAIPLSRYTHIRPICLPEKSGFSLKVGEICTVAGWGSTSHAVKKVAVSSPVLMKTEVAVIEDKVCQDKFGLLFNPESQICAGDLTGKTDSCVGDSGGPMMCSSEGVMYLMGVISSGPTPCAQPGTPAVYTDVQAARPWIESAILK